jgi:hypothetical protein
VEILLAHVANLGMASCWFIWKQKRKFRNSGVYCIGRSFVTVWLQIHSVVINITVLIIWNLLYEYKMIISGGTYIYNNNSIMNIVLNHWIL